MNQHPLLLFDGICNLCNGIVRLVIKADKKNKFKFASLQSDAAQALLKKFNLPTDEFESFVLIKGDEYFLKSTAILYILKELGGVWKMFYVLIIIPRSLRDFVYNIIARTRYRIFGKRDTCMVPTDDIKQKFLS